MKPTGSPIAMAPFYSIAWGKSSRNSNWMNLVLVLVSKRPGHGRVQGNPLVQPILQRRADRFAEDHAGTEPPIKRSFRATQRISRDLRCPGRGGKQRYHDCDECLLHNAANIRAQGPPGNRQ